MILIVYSGRFTVTGMQKSEQTPAFIVFSLILYYYYSIMIDNNRVQPHDAGGFFSLFDFLRKTHNTHTRKNHYIKIFLLGGSLTDLRK